MTLYPADGGRDRMLAHAAGTSLWACGDAVLRSQTRKGGQDMRGKTTRPNRSAIRKLGVLLCAASIVGTLAGVARSQSSVVTGSFINATNVSCQVDSAELWPPNHQLTNVGLSVSGCDSAGCTINVYSNQKDLETSSGDFSPDAKFQN